MKRSSIPPGIREAYDYDPDTGIFTHRRRLPGISPGDPAGCLGKEGYWIIMYGNVPYMAHRVAWFLVTGAEPPEDVDHINMVRSDNRFANLRLASRAENMRNTRAKSEHGKGVHFKASRGKFVAQIRIGGRQKHLGLYTSAEEAQAAYAAAAAVHHGEFARTE